MRRYFYLPSIAAIAMAAIGSMFTMKGLPGWYPTLAKPDWTPSGQTIGAAWSIIFVLFAFAGTLFFVRTQALRTARLGAGLIALNAVLNLAWSWLFFVRHEIFIAFWEAIALELSVLALIAVYGRISRSAALMLVPYAAWIAFAAYLNWQIHLLNP